MANIYLSSVLGTLKECVLNVWVNVARVYVAYVYVYVFGDGSVVKGQQGKRHTQITIMQNRI